MRRPGYTLLELSIVMGLAILLTTAIAVTIKGLTDAARCYRTGQDLTGLAGAAAAALKRNLVVQKLPMVSWSFRASNSGAPLPIGANQPLCYDLTRVQGRMVSDCPSLGAPGPNWSAFSYPPVNPLPADSPLLSLLGGGAGYGSGYNPWCLPYVACFYPFKVEIVTCVPDGQVNAAGLESALRCGACNTPSPLTNETTSCVVFGASALNQSSTQAALSYAPDEPGIDPSKTLILGPYDSTIRTVY